MKTLLIGLAILTVALFVSACGPAATPTAAPTATPAPTPVLATKAEDILGTWVGTGADALYQQFNANGTVSVAVVQSSRF